MRHISGDDDKFRCLKEGHLRVIERTGGVQVWSQGMRTELAYGLEVLSIKGGRVCPITGTDQRKEGG